MADKDHAPRAYRNDVANKRKVIFWLAGTVAFCLVFFVIAMNNSPSKHRKTTDSNTSEADAARSLREVKCQTVASADGVPENSPFRVTKTSKAYDVKDVVDCWLPNCKDRNNRATFVECSHSLATEWNTQGVHAMERYVQGDLKDLWNYHQNSLQAAIRFFSKAIEVDDGCTQVHVNLGLAQMAAGHYDDARHELEWALKHIEEGGSDVEIGKLHLYLGLVEELKAGSGDRANSWKHYQWVVDNAPELEHEIFGIANTANGRAELRNYGTFQEGKALSAFLLYKIFSPVPIARYALLDPGTQDWFVQNRYIVLRRILPPFVLKGIQECLNGMIEDGVLSFGDAQTNRYAAYNERCTRFLHHELADLIRNVIAHNARPSYTYFGGYKGGSILKPHTDRAQCEWTLSLQVKQTPPEKTWLLSLGKVPLFDRDDSRSGGTFTMPPEDEIVDADLYEGDALLFMGRHLVHFRRGALPEGQHVLQAFLHYVPEFFDKTLG